LLPHAHVLVVSDDPARCLEVCTVLDSNGFRGVGLSQIGDLASSLDGAAAVLVDVTTAGAAVDAAQSNVRSIVAGRCPIVLFGQRSTVTDVEGVTSLHIPWDEGGKTLVGFLRRLLGERTATRDAPAATEHQRPTRMPSRPDHARRARVLLVDDSEMTLDLVQARLVDLGFDVRIAMSFAEVGPIVTSFPPDVVVANVKRPDVPVTRLCTTLRATARGAMLLLGSSMNDAQLDQLARDAGADGWASKRLGLDTFVAQIEAHAARAGANAAREEVPRG
jgi:CheY-like chemotaxis protein